jgi:hypothetical protein
MNYDTIAQFIDCLKTKKGIGGVVEYGGRTYSYISRKESDYRLNILNNIWIGMTF